MLAVDDRCDDVIVARSVVQRGNDLINGCGECRVRSAPQRTPPSALRENQRRDPVITEVRCDLWVAALSRGTLVPLLVRGERIIGVVGVGLEKAAGI